MVRIRAYAVGDLAAAAALWRASWGATFPHLTHPWPPGRWRDELARAASEEGAVWIAEEEGAVAGFMVIDAAAGYLAQLFVAPNRQGGGIGAALLAWAKALSPRRLALHALVENRAASAFYERHGFVAGAASVNPMNGRANVEYVWAGVSGTAVERAGA